MEVVGARVANDEFAAFLRLAAHVSHGDLAATTQICARYRFFRRDNIIQCALTTTQPPCSPAPGPMSMTWSEARMTASSCSTTMTVLPRSRRPLRVSMRRALSTGGGRWTAHRQI